MSQRYRRRQAFSLTELLTVIGVVVIVLGISLPAVQRVRERAARNTCANNLRQLGLALHNFDSVFHHLPPAGTSQPEPFGNAWSAYLLPFLDQAPRYEQIDFSKPATYPVTVSALQTPLKVFQCPSAPQGRTTDFASADNGLAPGTAQLATTDYGPAFGIDSLLAPYLPPGASGATGAIQIDRPIAINEIQDGTSNTILLVEDAGRPQRWQFGTPLPDDYGGAPGGGWGDLFNGSYLHGLLRADGVFVPCVVNCSNYLGVYGMHTDGANVLAADGAVHFLSATTRPATLAALVSSSGNEDVSWP
jgi:type II secretory pathway pseudopilin PulG